MSESIIVSRVDSSANSAGVCQQIYQNVRRAIILGDLPSGSRINEQRLAHALGGSRVPLREAMPRLEADGFISSSPYRSAIVTGWSPARVMDVFDVRLALEPEAMRLATDAIRTGASTVRVEAALEEVERTHAELATLDLAERHADLYVRFVNLTGSGLMTSMMRTVSHHLAWLFYLSPLQDPEQVYEELWEVLHAVQAGAGELAKATMLRHIAKCRDPAIATIEAQTSDIPSSWTGS